MGAASVGLASLLALAAPPGAEPASAGGPVARGAAAPPVNTAEAETRARKLYVRGSALLQNQRYRDALAEFEAAYLTHPDPLYLYLQAECHWHLGDDATALDAYRRYRRAAPDAPNAHDVDLRIRTLESGRHVESLKAEPRGAPRAAAASPSLDALSHRLDGEPSSPQAAPQPAATAASPERRPVYARWWFWVAAAVVVGGAAAAVLILRER